MKELSFDLATRRELKVRWLNGDAFAILAVSITHEHEGCRAFSVLRQFGTGGEIRIALSEDKQRLRIWVDGEGELTADDPACADRSRGRMRTSHGDNMLPSDRDAWALAMAGGDDGSVTQ